MAEARRIPVPPPVRGVQLDLTYDEACFLKNVLMHVGGSPDRSPRQHSDAISRALWNAEIRNPESDRFRHLQRGGMSYEDGQPKGA